MTTRVRRRRPRELNAEAAWEADRDWQVQRAVNVGLGVRPEEWWRYDSGRPDLAGDDAELDTYAHLGGGPQLERATLRFRFLATTGELTPAERLAIIEGSGPRYAWRVAILARNGNAA
jgi:hypothetical protein